MKSIVRFLSLIFLISVMSACSSSFLNEKPTGQLTTVTFYKTADQANQALADGYRQMRLIAFFWYSKTTFGDVMSDNAAKGGGGASDQADIQLLKDFNAKPTNGYVSNAWRFNYRGIYLANLVIDKVPQIKMDSGEKARIIGEAKFLRGYFYLQLVRLFGNVPLILKPLKNGDYNQPQAPEDSVWTQIEKDASDAASVLPTINQQDPSMRGHATKAAAQALVMNCYMWKKKWQQAEQLGDQIINSGHYHLDPDYDHMWSIDGEWGPGSIFEINYMWDPGKGIGNYLCSFEGMRPDLGIGFVCPTQNLVDAFEKGDPRLKATVISNNEKMSDGTTANTTNSPTGYYSRKYWVPKSQNPQFNGGAYNDFPVNERVYRLAEIMLWDAEAAVHNGDVAHATDLVNQVRARARKSGGNTDMTILPPYTSVTLQNVYHEERVEQALGAHRRFFNLVRTGRAAQILPNYKPGISNHIPIPQREMQLSDGVLKQNKGY